MNQKIGNIRKFTKNLTPPLTPILILALKISALTIMSFVFLLIYTSPPLMSAESSLSQENQEKQEKTGSIKGIVVDAEVKSPLPLVQVTIISLNKQTLTDEEGQFSFTDIPVGSYMLQFSCEFYTTSRKTDIQVKSQRITQVHAAMQLEPSFRQKESITVTAGYFAAAEKQNPSTSQFSFEEIRRLAVPIGDVSRILSSLPSVISVNAMSNSLVVRGGNPAENNFFIDNIQIPNINHFPQLGSTAGAIGLLNIDFIRDVRFYSGGFSPQYGNSLSSVMDVRFREGNQDEHDFQLGLDMMGASVVGEGPLGRDMGSWMFSARRSYLDLLIELMGQGVPVTYSDFQGKINWNLSSKNRLSFLGIGGIDNSGTQKQDALEDNESYYGGLDTKEYTVGINWFSVWGSNGYSNTSLSQNHTRYKQDYFHTVSDKLARKGITQEHSLNLRNINHFRLSRAHELSFGFEFKHLTDDSDQFVAGYTDVLGNTVPSSDRDIRISDDMYAAFLTWNWGLSSQLDFTAGARLDYLTLSQNLTLSPRFSLTYNVSKKTSLQTSLGVFTQHLPLHLLSQMPNPEELATPRAYHFILALRHLLNDTTRLSVEVYDKEYHGLPMDPSQPELFLFDEVFDQGFIQEHESLVDTGTGRAYGMEVMVQKKLSDKLYGVISGSYFRSQYKGLDEIWRDRIYDNRFILSTQGGYKFNKHLESSFKWIFAGGYPYTPFDLEASLKADTGIYDANRINKERLAPIHYLNLRMDRRFYFRQSNLILYLTVWNVYNRKNVISYYWNTIEQKPDQVQLWGILPCFGLEFEF